MKFDKNLFSPKKLIAVVAIVFALIVLVYAISVLAPKDGDWRLAYYPAARDLISGHSPYHKGGYFENPIWACFLLVPFALFSENVSRALFFVVSLAAYYAAFASVETPRKWIPLVFLSPQILYGLNLSAIDPLVLAAPAFPPVLGFMLALAKPQLGIGYAIYLIVEWIRERDYRSLFLALTLSGVGFVASLWLGMPFSGRLISAPWNTSLFPYSLPFGVAALFISLRNRDKGLSFIASPMLSPYVGFYSWAVLYMLKKPKQMIGVLVLSWVAYLIWYFANV